MPQLTPNPVEAYNRPTTVKLKEIIAENDHVKTFVFDYAPLGKPVPATAGQFVMVWVPGVDEMPMSISKIGPGSEMAVTVQKVGNGTKAMFKLKVGDYIGVRGPFGRGFLLKEGFAIFLAGGVGSAPLMPAIREWVRKNGTKDIIVIFGARSENLLSFRDDLRDLLTEGENLLFCTDDGSYGIKGFTTQVLEETLDKLTRSGVKPEEITVYTCGPEIMMKFVVQIAKEKGTDLQASLERWMRCGMGVCGLCALDPSGILVCKAGPVFPLKVIEGLTDFGTSYRTMSGKKVRR